jgi:hypothetical protein
MVLMVMMVMMMTMMMVLMVLTVAVVVIDGVFFYSDMCCQTLASCRRATS